ncbi:MAG: DUF4446 family protein [Actinomycetota bacterium]|nr:DUF4446 family protein [Actinomycetota bacterium]
MVIGNIALAVLGLAWLVLALWLLIISLKVRGIKKREKVLAKAVKEEDFVNVVKRSFSEVPILQENFKELKMKQDKLAVALDTTVQRIGLVRFDAFSDVGGKLSFAVALLNNHGDGVVISTINGRQESRSYAKIIRGGNSEYALSDEERQAISEALARKV